MRIVGRLLVGAALVIGCGSSLPCGTVSSGEASPHAETVLGLAVPCSFTNNTVTVVLSANETATVALDVSGNLLVNGQACGTATGSTTRRLSVSAQDLASLTDETVVLDATNGFFAPGTSTGTGITVSLGAGTDTVQVIGTANADVLIAGRSSTDDWIIFNQDLFKDVSLVNVENLTLTGAGGDDVLSGASTDPLWAATTYFTTNLPTLRALTLEGNAGADTLTGGGGADTLRGGADDDTLRGSPGIDTNFGDLGADVFDEGAPANGADIFNGGGGTDTVRYQSRTNPLTVTLGSGANDGEASEGDDVRDDVEVVIGGAQDDTLTCSISSGCTLRGGPGADTLTGAGGPDVLEGQAGDDVLRPGAGVDTVNGGDGVDTITYSERSAAVTVTLGAAGVTTTGNGVSMENDSLVDLENVVGGSGNDTLTGNELANRLTGGPGADTLSGNDGDDVFDEGAAPNGADTLNGGNGVDRADYSARTTALTVSLDGTANDGASMEGDDVEVDVENVDGGSAGDTLTGNSSANELNGADGDDTLSGLAGNDVLSGGPGVDTLLGGDGDDTLEDVADGGSCDCGPGFDIAICDAPMASCEVR